MTPDWEALRAEFPALENWTYLNTATFGQMPIRARAAMDRHFSHRDELACYDFLSWFTDHDRLREKIAQLVHCESTDVAFTQNACSAMSILLNGIDWKPGDEIVTLEDEFPNQIYHPTVLERYGVTLRELPLTGLVNGLSERTRLILLSSVNYVTGLRPDLMAISEHARQRGILFAVDGTQSVGALEFDWSRIKADFLAVNCYKWMLTPNGVGFLAISPELRARLLPQSIGWRSHRTWRDVSDLHHGAPDFVESAEKYEGGMIPTTLLYALEGVVDMMLELGTANIESRVLDLAAQARAILREAGSELLYDKGLHYESGIVAARFRDGDAPTIAAKLKERRVLASARHGYLRISTHFYNNELDLANLRAALRDIER